MKHSVKATLITALILILAGSILAGVCIFLTEGDFSVFNTTQYAEYNHDVPSPFISIRIEASDHDVRIVPSHDDGCHLTVITPKRDSLTTEFDRGTLVIEIRNHRAWYENIGFNFQSPQIVLALPKDSYEDLGIHVTSGNIDVADGFTFQEVNLHTSSGNVFTSSLTAQDVFINVTSGRIELYDLQVENYTQLKTTSGNITLSNVESNGKIEAEVTSGDVLCDTLHVAGTIHLSSSSGDITLFDVQSQGGLRAEASSGRIECTNAITADLMDFSTTSGGIRLDNCDAGQLDLSTTSGSIKGHLLTDKIFVCDTGSGSIHVPSSTQGGICRVKTTSGSIRFE